MMRCGQRSLATPSLAGSTAVLGKGHICLNANEAMTQVTIIPKRHVWKQAVIGRETRTKWMFDQAEKAFPSFARKNGDVVLHPPQCLRCTNHKDRPQHDGSCFKEEGDPQKFPRKVLESGAWKTSFEAKNQGSKP